MTSYLGSELDGSTSDRPYFDERVGQSDGSVRWTVYISQMLEARSEVSDIAFDSNLTEIIDNVSNGLLTSVLHRVTAFLRCDVTEMENLLVQLEIRPCNFGSS